MKLSVLTNVTAGGTAAPTVVTDGVPLWKGMSGQQANQGLSDDVDEVEILVEATVTAATVGTIEYIRLYVWNPDAVASNKWFPLGGGPAADTGKLNAEATTPYQFEETGTNEIRHCERIRGLREHSRICARVGTIANVTRIDVTLVSRGKVTT